MLSTFIQDAVGQTAEIAWMRRQRRFSLLVNRFRWEAKDAAERLGRPFERVQALLVIDGVLKARGSGIDPSDRDLVFPILALAFDPGTDGAGTLRLVLAGDGEIALDVECLDVTLTDVSRPYLARASGAPRHPLD